MRIFLILSFSLLTKVLATQITWTTGTIPNSPNGVFRELAFAFNPSTNTLFAAWGDLSSTIPYYSTFDGTTWSAAAQITGSSTSRYGKVSLAFNPTTNTMFAAWADPMLSYQPSYSTFDGTSWSAPQPIDASAAANYNVTLAYNPDTASMFAAWEDATSNYPTYSTFSSGAWSTSAAIDTSYIYDVVALAFDPTTNAMFAAWSSANSTPIALPMFSIFSGGSWSPAAQISSTKQVELYVMLGFDSAKNAMFAGWGDYTTYVPYYTIYSGSWSTPATISATSSVDENVDFAFNPSTNMMISTWIESNGFLPYYSLFDGNAWNSPSAIPGVTTTNSGSVTIIYDPAIEAFVAGWTEVVAPYRAYYSVGVPSLQTSERAYHRPQNRRTR